MLQRLVRSLLENAIKHGEPPIDVSVQAESACVTLSVGDRGTGFSESDLGRVLEPFYRSESSKRSGGYGLGLALVARIVDMHEGRLTITNGEHAQGATVTVHFPRIDPE